MRLFLHSSLHLPWALVLLVSTAQAQPHSPALPDDTAPSGGLTEIPARPECNADFPGLPLEDFGEAMIPSSSVALMPNPLDASTDNDIFQPGDILPGLTVQSRGPGAGAQDAIYVGRAGTGYVTVGASSSGDTTDLSFDPGIGVLCLDYYTPVVSGDVVITVSDTGGNVLGTITRATTSFRTFFGVTADLPIGNVSFATDAATFAFVRDVAFGGEAGCEQSLSATVDDTTLDPGQRITFTVTVMNTAATSAPLDLWFEAFRNGNTVQRARLGSGILPAGATVTRNVPLRVPSGTPAGTYTLDLILGDYASDDACDSVPFTFTVSSAPQGRSATEPAGASAKPFEMEAADYFGVDAVSGGTRGATAAPNPFSRQSRITYALEDAAYVRLSVYDVLGREVAVLVDADMAAGTQSATFDARGLAAGTYVYRLVIGDDVQTGRLTLAR